MIWAVIPIVTLLGYWLGIALVRRFWPGSWRLVRDTGVHQYFEHSDGRRKFVRVNVGYQPVDNKWLETGEWTNHDSR